jgi:uncharacterized protein (DUF302 family)
LTEAAQAVPMGVLAHINGQANCAKKGIEVPADQVLEIFRPDFAIRVWKAHKPAGIDIPLRIHLYAADGKTVVSYRTAERSLRALCQVPELTAIAPISTRSSGHSGNAGPVQGELT